MPTGWDSVTIGQWQELNTLAKEDYDNDAKLLIEQLSIICNQDSSVIAKLPMEQVSKMSQIIAGYDHSQLESHDATFELDGIKYGIVPKLESLTFGEWVDLEQMVKNPSPNMHKIISILYRPVTKTKSGGRYEIDEYDAEECAHRATMFADKVTIDRVYNALVFFCAIEKQSTEDLTTYLEALTKMTKTMVLKAKMNAWLERAKSVLRLKRGKNGTG